MERSIVAAVDSASNARAAGADEDGAIANVEYGFVDSSSEDSEMRRRARARDEAKKTLDKIAGGSARASPKIDWKKATSGDYDDEDASAEEAETVEEEDKRRPKTRRGKRTQPHHRHEREHDRARRRESSEKKEKATAEALEAEELDPNAVRDADGFVCAGSSSASSSSRTARGSKGRGRDAAALGVAPGIAGGSRPRYTFEFFERLSAQNDAARRSPAVEWRRRWGSAAAAAPAGAAVVGVVATIALRRARRGGDDGREEREERAPLVADDRV